VSQCATVDLQYGGGQVPYFIDIIPPGNINNSPYQTIPQQSVPGTYAWLASIPAGTDIALRIRDGSGNIQVSSPVTVQQGDSSFLQ